MEVLRQAIAELPPDSDEIHLQLSGLDFIDMIAARELLALTTLPSCPVMILHYPPAELTRLMRLAWPDVCGRIRIEGVRCDGTGWDGLSAVGSRQELGSQEEHCLVAPADFGPVDGVS